MKSLKFTLILAMLASFVFISCENEPLTGTFTDETGTGSGSGSGSGGGSGTGTSTGDYFPRAVGNIWTYNVSTGGTDILEIDGTSTHNSVTYYDFVENNGFGAIRKSAASYFSRIAVELESPAYIITGTPFEIKFLQDDATVGSTINNPVSTTYTYTPLDGNPAIPDATVNMNYKYTMESRDISREVNGVMYDNILHLSHVLESNLTPDTTGDYYFAKDIGLIEYRVDNNTYTLTSYSLN